MRSIRRTSITYLLLLLGLALAGVGLLVDQFAREAIHAREGAETQRIKETYDLRWKAEADRKEQAYKLRSKEVEAKFDTQLRTEAQALTRELRFKLFSLLNPGRPGGP